MCAMHESIPIHINFTGIAKLYNAWICLMYGGVQCFTSLKKEFIYISAWNIKQNYFHQEEDIPKHSV